MLLQSLPLKLSLIQLSNRSMSRELLDKTRLKRITNLSRKSQIDSHLSKPPSMPETKIIMTCLMMLRPDKSTSLHLQAIKMEITPKLSKWNLKFHPSFSKRLSLWDLKTNCLRRSKLVLRVTPTPRLLRSLISIFQLMKERLVKTLRSTILRLQVTNTDTQMLFCHMSTVIFKTISIPKIWMRKNLLKFMLTTVFSSICISLKLDQESSRKSATSHHTWTKLPQVSLTHSIWTICSSSITIDGESPPDNFWTSSLDGKRLCKTGQLSIIGTRKVPNMTLSGLRTKNSLTSLLDSVSQCWEKSHSKRSWVLRELQPTQVINSNHSFRPHQWSLTPLWTSPKERSSTRTPELENGANSGRLPPPLFLVWAQVSTSSKFIKLMEHHLFLGWPRTGIGSISQDNSRTVPAGTSRVSDIVMTTTTWTSNTARRDRSWDQPIPCT